jgi:hypothetical protein
MQARFCAHWLPASLHPSLTFTGSSCSAMVTKHMTCLIFLHKDVRLTYASTLPDYQQRCTLVNDMRDENDDMERPAPCTVHSVTRRTKCSRRNTPKTSPCPLPPTHCVRSDKAKNCRRSRALHSYPGNVTVSSSWKWATSRRTKRKAGTSARLAPAEGGMDNVAGLAALRIWPYSITGSHAAHSATALSG